MDDSRLLRRLKGGDSDALEELLALHWDAVVKFGIRVYGSADTAEDLAQDAFIALWERRQQLASDRPDVLVLLLRMVRNRSNNLRRHAKVRERYEHAQADDLDDRTATPEQLLHARELSRAVDASIRALPERRREILILSRFHGFSHARIAEALEISPQTVANQMSRALADLRAALDPMLDVSHPL